MSATDSIQLRTAPPELDHTLDDLILPEWSTGGPILDPADFVIDAGGSADLDAGSELGERMRATFDHIGLVHVVNTGLTELADMRTVARHALEGEMPYEGGANPRRPLEKNTSVFEVGAPHTAHLHYHHEMAYVAKSTRALGFLCKSATPGKGSTYVSDGFGATDALLQTEFGRKLREKGVCYHRNLTDRDDFVDRLEIGVYNHWQLSMDTDDPEEAEAYARERGLVTEWGPNRLLKTRYYADAFEFDPRFDRNLLYSSLADHGMWFDGWPLVMHLPYEERPLHMTFGDDTEFTREERRQFIEIYDRFGMAIEWSAGEVAVVDNLRFAHGRPAIHLADGEERQLGVLLGQRYDRLGQRDDRW